MAARKAHEIMSLPDGNWGFGGGLYLRVSGGGKARSWAVRRRVCGKDTWRGLGSAYDLKLSRARELAKSPPPPSPERKATVREAFAEFVEAQESRGAWKETGGTRATYESAMRNHCLPFIGGKPVALVTEEDIDSLLLKDGFARKTPVAAEHLVIALRALFSFCAARRLRNSPSPVVRERVALVMPARRERPHMRSLSSLAEAKDLASALRDEGGATASRLLFCWLTATRISEALSLRMEDVRDGVWHLPAERRKGRKSEALRIPLSRQALKVVEAAAGEEGSRTEEGLRKYLVRRNPGTTIHGFRTTFRNWAAENGKDFVACEVALGHTVGTRVVASYLRTDMLEKRREIMQEWGDFLLPDGDVSGEGS